MTTSNKATNANIIIAATMSAGKTSLVNALIGKEILWSSNEAATATITRIQHLLQILKNKIKLQRILNINNKKYQIP